MRNHNKFRFPQCSLATWLGLIAVLIVSINAWLGAVLAVTAAWLNAKQPAAIENDRVLLTTYLPLWFALPVIIALCTLAYGEALPPDDLRRHLSAWKLGFDYRAQYPWSDLPKANLWLGFDYLLGRLQATGISATTLLQWIPGFGLVLSAGVIYGGLYRNSIRARQHPELLLIIAALGLLLVTPRALLGRPEALYAALGGAAWLCKTRKQAVIWLVAFIAVIPGYWLGWAYAPFAVLLPLKSLRARIGAVAGLGVAHVAFWQCYTGNYLALLHWLSGTLSVVADENVPMAMNLTSWSGYLFFLLLTWALAIRVQQAAHAATWRQACRKLIPHTPVVLISIWLIVPNQVRYQAAIAFALLPWLFHTLCIVAVARRRSNPITIPAVLVMAALALAAVLQVPKLDPAPKFALSASARVYSEQPYATVFYGLPGIAVEPSFAIGATLPQWKGLLVSGRFDCRLAVLAGLTHVVEKSLTHLPECGVLQAVQGPWRLWAINPSLELNK